MLEGMISKELGVILRESGVVTKLDDVNKWLQKYVVNTRDNSRVMDLSQYCGTR